MTLQPADLDRLEQLAREAQEAVSGLGWVQPADLYPEWELEAAQLVAALSPDVVSELVAAARLGVKDQGAAYELGYERGRHEAVVALRRRTATFALICALLAALIAPSESIAMPAGSFASPLAAVTWQGVVNYATPSHGRWYLAIPAGPGIRVRICGPAGCLERTSTDAGPDLAQQRAGRIADLNSVDWQRISGVGLKYGGFPGTVLVLSRVKLPETDTLEGE